LKILKNVATYKSNKKTFVTIGTFDGVHKGHQKVIKNLVKSAHLVNATSVLLTFFPHPRMVLQDNITIKLINTINERIELLKKTGLDILIIQEFTESFSNYTALDFVKSILVDTLHIDTLIIGYDHKFGKNRKGDFKQLETYGKTFGFNVQEISKKEIANFTISSTKIRKALELGEIEKVNNYLGYPYMLTGTVVQGKNLGEKIGFPTANIEIKDSYKLLPKTGAYIVKSNINNLTIFGMMNIGYRPTVQGKNQTIEVHFFDFNENLYDTIIQIDVLSFLREEQKFDSVESLKNQLAKDKETSLAIINGLLFDS
jgi:riboflavin kinase/FMN adenylyltransferase